MGRIRELVEYREMTASLVRRELRGKYKGSILGFLWTFINPLCQIVIYTVVFSMIMRSGLESFNIYMISGMIPWFFFSGSVLQGAGCIRAHANMVKKIYFPREVLPVVVTTFQFINMLLSFIFIIAVVIVEKGRFNPIAWGYLPLVMLTEYLLALGLALLVSACTVYFRDLEHITSVLLMAWVYLTPIFYSMETIPDYLLPIFRCNPMTPMIEMYHSIIYYAKPPETAALAQAFLSAIAFLVLGSLVFGKLEENFAEEL